ncbi:spermatogenesis-associated protein 32 [Artibeus jamaicensis]|uniref:spermatogenesis-associated protein 32 n=1 Tax=Artibeus jamaicensis TaxID=9417 RepID=UPI00235AC2DC|nr:spermatogenesis-associated protein 32 [Artibeus jamaicensis]
MTGHPTQFQALGQDSMQGRAAPLPESNLHSSADFLNDQLKDLRIDINQHQHQLERRGNESEVMVGRATSFGETYWGDASAETFQWEDKSLEPEPPRKADPDPDTELEEESVPPLEWCPAPMLEPEAPPASNLEACSEDPEQAQYQVEPVQPCMEELPKDSIHPQSGREDVCHPSPMEEEPVAPAHHSIHVQTSKHLFWADKLVQASEQSVQSEISRQLDEKSTEETVSHPHQESVPEDALCSEEPLQNPSTQPELWDTGSGQPPSTPSSSSLAPAISLQDVVNLATSLALASSSKVDLPNLEYMMKADQGNAAEPSPAPPPSVESFTSGAKEEPEQEKPSELLQQPPEKLLEAREPEKVCKQKNKQQFPLHFDLSKLGPQKAIIEGKVKFIQAPVMSTPPTEGRDSEPGTKKGSPLLLKIHFKLSSPSSPVK